MRRGNSSTKAILEDWNESEGQPQLACLASLQAQVPCCCQPSELQSAVAHTSYHSLTCSPTHTGESLGQAHLVVRPPQLEAEYRLHVLALEQDAAPEQVTQLPCLFQGCLDLHMAGAGALSIKPTKSQLGLLFKVGRCCSFMTENLFTAVILASNQKMMTSACTCTNAVVCITSSIPPQIHIKKAEGLAVTHRYIINSRSQHFPEIAIQVEPPPVLCTAIHALRA